MQQTSKEVIDNIEVLVRSAKMSEAVRALRLLRPSRLTRNQRLTVAALARRASVPEISVKILQPIIRPPSSVQAPATVEEKAEYAASLVRIGASREAMQILKTIPLDNYPQAKLYYVFALIANWEYELSVPLLEQLVQSTSLETYSKLIAKVNLGAAYVFTEKYTSAFEALHSALETTRQQSLTLLSGNILQFLAQASIEMQKWVEAERYLEEARSLLTDQRGIDSLFITKWRAIAGVIQSPHSKPALLTLQGVRDEAISRGHWETVRSCDFHQAISQENTTLYLHLYMGTPYKAFRDKLAKKFPKPVEIPEVFYWDASDHSDQVVETLLGKPIKKNGPYLKEGQAMHRLLAVLASDFYRTFRIATIYSAIFPNEYFNSTTSPTRVHQLVKRLKAFLRKGNLITIKEGGGAYRLELAPEVRLLVPQTSLLDRGEQYFEKIRAQLGTSFSSEQVGKLLGMTPRRALFFLQQYVQAGKLIRSRRGNSYEYVVTENKAEKKIAS